MSPLLYLAIGLIVGGLLAPVITLLLRRGKAATGVETELVKRLEMIDRGLRDEFSRNREEAGGAAKNQREELAKSLESVRSIVDDRLRQLQEDNAKQIDKMRSTVDEKLQGTLEKRLGESFKLVSDRLEQVHQGLGAMQQLASDVGGLQRVLTNVKTRGGWSEWQLTRCRIEITRTYFNPPKATALLSCFCRARDFTRKRFGASAWCKTFNAIAALHLSDQLR